MQPPTNGSPATPKLRRRRKNRHHKPGGQQQSPPARVRITLSLSPAEKAELQAAAAERGLTTAAYAAEAALRASRGDSDAVPDALRLQLRRLMHLAGQIRRCGTNLNQAVAALNTTGTEPRSLQRHAEECMRIVRRVDGTAERIRRSLP